MNGRVVYGSLSPGIDPGSNPGAVNDDIVSELSEQCRQMRPRVVALVQSVSDEELLMAALALNNDLSEAKPTVYSHTRLVDLSFNSR